MSHIRRTYCPQMSTLESRQLLAARIAPMPPAPPMVSFALSEIVVSEQSDSATITLTRNIGNTTYHGPLQVRVFTNFSPSDGVNLAPIDQVVSFPADTSTPFVPTATTTVKQAHDAATAVQTQTITIPIIRDATIPDNGPIPGETVSLDLQVIDGPPDTIVNGTMLEIVPASDVIAPTVTGNRVTSRGIELTFSEPLDPSTAQNAQNYLLTTIGHLSASDLKFLKGDSLLNAAPPAKKLPFPKPFHPRSAVYDAATQTVTLITPKSVANSSMIGVIGSGVTDPSGNPVNRDSAETQGMNMFSENIYPAQHASRPARAPHTPRPHRAHR